jgi:hypothetical protein
MGTWRLEWGKDVLGHGKPRLRGMNASSSRILPRHGNADRRRLVGGALAIASCLKGRSCKISTIDSCADSPCEAIAIKTAGIAIILVNLR